MLLYMVTSIDIVEREELETSFLLIVECNGYENGERVVQYSRSPFKYPKDMTDEEIIEDIKQTEYQKYF